MLIVYDLVLCVVVHASIAPVYCDTNKEGGKQVNISGVYQLEEVENYEEYLLAMDIPKRVARRLEQTR